MGDYPPRSEGCLPSWRIRKSRPWNPPYRPQSEPRPAGGVDLALFNAVYNGLAPNHPASRKVSPKPEQLSLSGFEPTPPTDRFFFAIFPSADAAERIAQLAQQLRGKRGLTGKPLATERFHITLHHLGDYVGLPQGIVDAAKEAAASVVMPPFDVAFDHAVSFLGRPRARPFVLRGGDGVAALMEFQQTLGTAMTKAGLGRWVPPHYTPHVTLLYDDRVVDEQAVASAGWTVHEFVLVRSLLGRAEHIPLERWPLRTRLAEAQRPD